MFALNLRPRYTYIYSKISGFYYKYENLYEFFHIYVITY